MELEKRAYGPDSSKEEIQLIRDRIFHDKLNDCIIYQELPVLSSFSISLFKEGLDTIIQETKCGFLVVDVSNISAPSGSLASELKTVMKEADPRLTHVAVGGVNALVRVVAKFILSSVFKNATFSISNTLEEAIEKVKEKQGELV